MKVEADPLETGVLGLRQTRLFYVTSNCHQFVTFEPEMSLNRKSVHRLPFMRFSTAKE